MSARKSAFIAIACGGTGGHLFPGIAVAQELEAAGAEPRLFVSAKEVDQIGAREVAAERVIALPAAAYDGRRPLAFVRGLMQSYGQARRALGGARPAAVLGMGGFASVAPVLAARGLGARVFLHEANSVAGRANRWLSWLATESFVYFPTAARGLRRARVHVVGMPVRDRFRPLDRQACRARLGLAPDRPTVLIMGGSQGAVGLNEAFLRVLPLLRLLEPRLQYIHLTGQVGYEAAAAAYAQPGLSACVRPFLADIEIALGAADVALSRAGASSLAELAVTRLPAILIPFPAAAQDHQVQNARQFAAAGAARMVLQAEAVPERLLWEIRGLLRRPEVRGSIGDALTRQHYPDAARVMARRILEAVSARHEPAPRPRVGVAEAQPQS